MTNEAAIRATSAAQGNAVATGLVLYTPVTPGAGRRSGSTIGTVGLPQGTYGTESVPSRTLALVTPTAANSDVMPPPPASLGLTAPVGNGKTNNYADVKKVQNRLVELGFPVDADGLWGPQTRWYLMLFSAISSGLEKVDNAVGVIGPGSFLDAKLADAKAPNWQALASDGTGWVRIDTDGYGWTTQAAVDVLGRAGVRYQESYRKDNTDIPRLMVNDLSRRDGSVLRRYGKDEHATHRTGLDIDLRLPRKAAYGSQTGSKTNWKSYDREATYAMIDAFARDDRVERVILHDATIKAWAVRDGKTWVDKLKSNDRGHRDHMHVDVKAPWDK